MIITVTVFVCFKVHKKRVFSSAAVGICYRFVTGMIFLSIHSASISQMLPNRGEKKKKKKKKKIHTLQYHNDSMYNQQIILILFFHSYREVFSHDSVKIGYG